MWSGNLSNVGAVDLNPATRRIIKAAEELYQSALAGPVRSHERNDSAGGNGQAEIIQRPALALWITKRDVVKPDLLEQISRGRDLLRQWFNYDWFERQDLKEIAKE